MHVRHDSDDLERLENDASYTGSLDKALVRAFRKVLVLVRSVQNETELYAWKSLRFEKLKGKRSHQRSLRLNQQWRLIVEIEEGTDVNTLVVKRIEDYH